MNWISIKDELPPDDEHIICNVRTYSLFDEPYNTVNVIKHESDGVFTDSVGIYPWEITHWMLFPEPTED